MQIEQAIKDADGTDKIQIVDESQKIQMKQAMEDANRANHGRRRPNRRDTNSRQAIENKRCKQNE